MIRRSSYTAHRRARSVSVPATSRHRAYTYHSKAMNVYVPSSLIPNRGRKGKGPKSIKITHPGKLAAYGYTTIASTPNRHRALNRAVAANTPLHVLHSLLAIAALQTRTMPRFSKMYRANANYVSKKYIHH